MKLPNGYGSVSKMSGKRRHPWRVRKTTKWVLDPVTGKAKQQSIVVGYYATKAEALQALSEYNKDPFDLKFSSKTMKEVYEEWSERKFTEISDQNIKGYKAAWKLCEPIQNMRFVDIRIDHLQKLADESGKNTPTLKKFKVMLKGLFDYAVVHGIITQDRNIVSYLDITHAGNPNARSHTPFTTDQVDRLWEVHESNEYYSIILMLIYTGLRIGELLDLEKKDVHLDERWFFVKESKTDAGIRSVPIARKVMPFFEYWYNKNDCAYLISTPDARHFEYRNYFDSYWKPLLKHIGMESHRPHDTRHTCISMLTAAKVDERFIQKIVGHKGQNVTQQVYTHLEIEELIAEINKI